MRPAGHLQAPWTIPLILAVFAACGRMDNGEQSDVGTADTAMSAMTEGIEPDTTASGMSDYLNAVNYRETWDRWPGTTDLYQATEPHGVLLSTYVNELALEAVTSGASAMPVGAVIVKDNYMPDSSFAAVTVMYKTSGYNADHNDWYFFKRLADGTVEASGRVAGCQDCHGGRSDNDYIMTETLGTASQ